MITTPNMGLKAWDQSEDVFSYTELSDNFAALDAHDHSPGKGVQIPTAGLANSAITAGAFGVGAIDSSKIAANSVTTVKLADGGVADTKLVAPTNGIWRTVWRAPSCGVASIIGVGVGSWLRTMGTNYALGVSTAYYISAFTPLTLAERTIPGKTTKARLLASMRTNAIAAPNLTIVTAAMQRATSNHATGLSLTPTGSPSPEVVWTFPPAGPSTSSQYVSIGPEVDFTTAFPVDAAAYAPMITYNYQAPGSHMNSYDLYLQVRYV